MKEIWAIAIGLVGILLIVYGMMSRSDKKKKDFMFKEITGADIFSILRFPMDEETSVKITTLPAGHVYELHEYHNIQRMVKK